MLDIAHHIIADMGFRQPGGYKDAIVVLEEEGLLEAALSRRPQQWVGFRNVLVHFYLEIDHGRSYDAIQEDLSDLEAFARSMSRLLEEQA